MSVSPPEARTGLRVHVQRVGTFLSSMVMPNIGAFIAWGLLTALFIEKGWITSLTDAWGADSWVAEIGGWGAYEGGGIVSVMITYLLPILIGAQGGRLIYGTRGAVVGAIATMGVVAGAEVPMFLGAMIVGPLGGWLIKKLDGLWEHRIRPGFEMLVNNFSAGISGAVLAVFGFFGIGPVVTAFSDLASDVVDFLVEHSLLPLTSVFIEPAKVLFLNNAINHGILTPLGTNQAAETGKSILFLLEANPGPGLGLLLAFVVFGRGAAKASASGAAVIHVFGGIHEIYFPYVLMKPKLIVAVIAGGMTGVLINVVFDSGLRAPAAPGSILAVYAQTASGSYLGVTLSVIGATVVAFLIAAVLLRTDRAEAEPDLAAATATMEAMKGKRSIASTALRPAGRSAISTIVFACDAGMGSSAMGASVLRKRIRAAGFTEVSVVNQAIANLTDSYDLVVTHTDLAERARARTPSAVHVTVDNFMDSPAYGEIVEMLAGTADPGAGTREPELLAEESVVLAGRARDADGAIDEVGALLVAAGAVGPDYVAAMHEREHTVSTFMGNGLAIPHGTLAAKDGIRHSAIALARYPEPVEWNGHPVEFVLGIAAAGDDHLALLSRIATVFADAEQVDRLRSAATRAEIAAVLGAVDAPAGVAE
ncbi:PTS mannose transporter subunit IIA [Nocardia neocaledoniensis NBRC 108232]|uniref:Mannitol-specific phosphotransferase enzyme IIA component n=1 Tax=Nocardia neocaledoniensis TaxID=236511 RepID=A0A317N6I0_9NOCA|nr:PTS mannitol transporter subunit IICBA [Nocardia neocaledoniensis]PWV70612.1 PTS system D-mannitol-specific IIA component (Fru family) /PTS system D-mannitol-specific IIB component (Fru family) /PTS system D-mannitol-specific IIC component (Fru family) [Nocardia neocaledoniensis]GEM34943.1 PTS mannose transporter subunit IIA [Nocardia neocaledoniensis NBRC 108232]